MNIMQDPNAPHPLQGLLGALPMAGLGAMLYKKNRAKGAMAGLLASQMFAPMLKPHVLNFRDQGSLGIPNMPGYQQWNNGGMM